MGTLDTDKPFTRNHLKMHPFREEILPNVQPEAMTSGPAASYLGEDTTAKAGHSILARRQPTDYWQVRSTNTW